MPPCVFQTHCDFVLQQIVPVCRSLMCATALCAARLRKKSGYYGGLQLETHVQAAAGRAFRMIPSDRAVSDARAPLCASVCAAVLVCAHVVAHAAVDVCVHVTATCMMVLSCSIRPN